VHGIKDFHYISYSIKKKAQGVKEKSRMKKQDSINSTEFHESSMGLNRGLINIIQKMGRICAPYVIIMVLVTLSYLPTFTGGFILDDNPLIKKNSYIKEMHSIPSYLTQEDGIVDKRDRGTFHTGYYRPLINLTYNIDYKLWGMNAPGFRTTNLILHLLSCFFLFKLLSLLVNDRNVAMWVSFLFALHPVNTESVSWIISRNNILVTLFVLSSFYFYIIWWEKKSYVAGILSLISFLGAIFSKEFGLMIMPIFFLYHRFLSQKKRDILLEFTHYVPFIILSIFYFFLRKNVTGAFLTPFDAIGFFQTIYFTPYVLIWNLKLIFVPSGLHFFYVSYPLSFYHWHAITSIGLVLLLVIALWIKRDNKLLLFSGLSFVVLIFPVLNIIPSASTSVTLVAMRWLYLPMAFTCLGVALIIQMVLVRSKMLATTLLIAVLLYFGVYTHILNKSLWQNENRFFRQEVLGFNNDFFAGDLAEKLLENKDYQEAEKYFKIAIEKYPDKASQFINYSALLLETGRPDVAISYLNRAQPLTLTYHQRGQWFNNMGMALFRLEKKNEALRHFKKAVIFAPDEIQFWANLGSVYGLMGDYENSAIALKKGLAISLESIQLRENLAMTYINLKDYEKAVLTLEEIPAHKRENNKSVLRLLRLAHEKLLIKQH
jgi:tetratricopeptide (TPR) repeat protein